MARPYPYHDAFLITAFVWNNVLPIILVSWVSEGVLYSFDCFLFVCFLFFMLCLSDSSIPRLYFACLDITSSFGRRSHGRFSTLQGKRVLGERKWKGKKGQGKKQQETHVKRKRENYTSRQRNGMLEWVRQITHIHTDSPSLPVSSPSFNH